MENSPSRKWRFHGKQPSTENGHLVEIVDYGNSSPRVGQIKPCLEIDCAYINYQFVRRYAFIGDTSYTCVWRQPRSQFMLSSTEFGPVSE